MRFSRSLFVFTLSLFTGLSPACSTAVENSSGSRLRPDEACHVYASTLRSDPALKNVPLSIDGSTVFGDVGPKSELKQVVAEIKTLKSSILESEMIDRYANVNRASTEITCAFRPPSGSNPSIRV